MESIQLARYDRVFDAYAIDGYLTRDGFKQHTEELARIQGKSSDDPAIVAFDAELAGVWAQLEAMADTDHDGRVSRDEWRAAALAITGALREAVDAGAEPPFQEWVDALYGVIDADGDGSITQDEYATWLTALGFGEDTDVAAAFAGFDLNADGVLSVDEFRKCYVQFWLEFDSSVPGHRWIGP